LPNASSAPQGKEFGKFTLIEMLGRGGMGEVWKAFEKDLKRTVAIKFIQGNDPTDEKRFRREAETVARLNHPHIAQMYEIGAHDGRTYLSMQLVNGVTIDKLKIDERVMLKAARDVAAALDFAHKQGVIHRDIKPSNIMVEGTHAYLMDFGLARSNKVDSSISFSGMIVGTPQYMAPEQARGQTSLVDARSDIYSLGATLYTLLAGRPPYVLGPDEDVMGLLRRVAEEEPPKFDASWELQTIVFKAMDKDRERRYQTAMEMAEDLQRYLDGEAIHARRASTIYRLRKKLVKHRWAALATAAAVVIGLGFGGYLLVSNFLRERDRSAAVAEAVSAEKTGRWKEAMAAYERAFALGASEELRQKKENMAQRVQKEKADLERANAEKAAKLIYQQSAQDLHMIRLRSYRPGWKMTDSEFQEFQKLSDAAKRQMDLTGSSAEGWWIVGQVADLKGDWAGAQKAYEQGLQTDPKHEGCAVTLARSLIRRSLLANHRPETDPQQIQAWVKRALDLVRDVKGEGFETDLARGYLLSIEDQPVEDYCRRMIEKWQGKDFYEEFYLLRGVSAIGGTVSDFDEAVRIRPGYYEAILWRSVARRQAKDFARSLEDCNRALELHPRLIEAYNDRGWSHFGLREYRKALEDFSRALELNPESIEGLNGRGGAKLALRDFAGAEQDFAAAIRVSPPMAILHSNRALARLRSKNYDGAIADADRAIELYPRYAKAYSTRAQAYSAKKKFPKAMEDFDRSIEIAPDAGTYSTRGVTRLGMKDVAGAIRDFNEALRLDPRHARAYSNLGSLNLSMGNPARAIQFFDKALECDPELVEAYVGRCAARRESNDLAGALEDGERALKRDDTSAEAHVNVSSALFLAGRIPEALRSVNRGIELNPEYALAYSNRALIYEQMKDWESALKDYDAAIRLDSTFADAVRNRGWAWMERREFDKALADFTRWTELRPKDPDARLYRAGMLDRLGRFEEAAKDAEQALTLGDSKWPGRRAAEALLAKLRSKLK
jgi:tetratricopeptide (TPR) repeat protein